MARSIWQESMRIGFLEFDEQRKAMLGVIEQLDVDPSHSLSNEFFLIRFRVLEAAGQALYAHEELLMKKWAIPESHRVAHQLDHARILSMLNDVYFDSMNHKKENALGKNLSAGLQMPYSFGLAAHVHLSTLRAISHESAIFATA